MTIYSEHYDPNRTPQTEAASAKQQPNSAGGFSFVVDDWSRLDRFLILGAEGGSYYASERELTRDNAKAVERCLDEDGARVVARIVDISESGRAPKNSPAIFALALAAASKSKQTRAVALAALPRVCRTGTHLFEFVASVEKFRGWGRGLRKAVGRWYAEKDVDALGYQLMKYQSRAGWSHRDVLRLSHWTSSHPMVATTLRYVVAGRDAMGPRTVAPAPSKAVFQREPHGQRSYAAVAGNLPEIVVACDAIRNIGDGAVTTAAGIIRSHGLTHEMVPSHFLARPEIWEALLERMPMTAMIRNLGRMTANGLLAPMSASVRLVTERLGDVTYLKKSRIHPLSVLTALRIYAQGRGMKGKLAWTPVQPIVDALNEAFYTTFDNVVPTGKRTLLALDVSGSMGSCTVAGSPLTPREASAALALVTARTEPNHHIMGFCSKFIDLRISPKQRLDDVVRTVSNLQFGNTDCGLPMVWAKQNKVEVDVYNVYTDSETYCGTPHPHQSLKTYRKALVPGARLAVVGMVANSFTIADPGDAGMLDVVGFDTATPALLAAFARGEM